jgi:hypothetical protein
MKKHSIIVFFIFSAFVLSCIDPFEVNIPASEFTDLIVVDAVLNRESAVHSITLSRPTAINQNSGYARVSKAKVEITDSNNECFEFKETSNGTYSIDSTMFKPKFEEDYLLNIELANGELYQSEAEKLKIVDPIDSVWVRAEKISFLAGSNVIEGNVINVYTNLKTANEDFFHQYEYEGTFGFESVYQGSDVCNEGGPIIHSQREELICYRSEIVDLPLNIFSTRNLQRDNFIAQNILQLFPDRKFLIGYSLLVKKKRLTEQYYNYLDEIKTQNEAQGSLFDPPPTTIEGNIRNISNDDFALGFFTIVSETQKRVFIYNDILREEVYPYEVERCQDNFDEFDPLEPVIEIFILRPESICCDCRLYPGATDKEPDFFPVLGN